MPSQHLKIVPGVQLAQDEVVDFGTTLDYTCLDGHSFVHDPNLQSLPVVCQEDGSWSVGNLEEFFCVSQEGTA